MNIFIGQGLNMVRFGTNFREVKKILGKPDKSYEDEYGDFHALYFETGIILKFEKLNNMELHWLEVHNRKISFDFLPKTWLYKKENLIKVILEQYNTSCSVDDYGAMESVYFNDIALELQFELGRLDCICIGSF